MSGTNYHFYPSAFTVETRILKITKTLADAEIFDKIYIFATWEPGLPLREGLDDIRVVIRIPRKVGETKTGSFWKIVRTLEWYWKLFRKLKDKKVDCINCHSLSVLPFCVFLKFIRRSKLLYDTHELETETMGTSGLRKVLAKIVEKVLIGAANEVVVVNDFIAKWYRETYGINNVWTVRNFPYPPKNIRSKTNILSKRLNIPENGMLFLYLGAIAEGRGVDILLNVFSMLEGSKHIIFMGFGDLVDKVKMFAKMYSNIHFHETVRPNEINHFVASADVGLSIIENASLSYYLCLPNKLFEYVTNGLPVIVSDYPAMSEFIDKYGFGWKVPFNKSSIGLLIKSINRDAINEKRAKAFCAREHIDWRIEERTVINIYRNLEMIKKTKERLTGRKSQ
jgi:glycosyltransferase involved in cell wall biosynthesis